MSTIEKPTIEKMPQCIKKGESNKVGENNNEQLMLLLYL